LADNNRGVVPEAACIVTRYWPADEEVGGQCSTRDWM